MRVLLKDLRYGLRMLRRDPGFSLLAIGVIALGIGANSAIFSVLHGVILNPLPYRDSDRLVLLWSDLSRFGGGRRAPASPPDFLDWRERARSFEALAAFENQSFTFTGLDQPVTPLAHGVSANYFDVLGVKAHRGRTFLTGEDRPGRNRVAMISHRLWQTAFGGDEQRIGRRVELDGESYELVGVAPPGFHSPNVIAVQPDLWVPMPLEPRRAQRLPRTVGVIARLRPATSVEQAQAEIAGIGRGLGEEHPKTNDGLLPWVQPIREDLVGQFRPTFHLLLAAVGFVLLIACGNVANMLLARSTVRAREMALRSALGASRSQIVRQSLVESVLLAGSGAALGLAFAGWGVGPLLALIPESAGMPFLEQVRVDGAMVAFTAALALITGLVFGLAPAGRSARQDLAATLKEGGRSAPADGRGLSLRNLLIVGEVALSLMLLAGAGLMLQSFWRLSRMEAGFQPAGVLTVRNSLRGDAYGTPAARRIHFQNALRKIEAVPGVLSASATSFPPPLANFAAARFQRPDKPSAPGQEPSAIQVVAMPRFFETMRIPLLRGRTFREQDSEDSERVAVVSSLFAERYFPGEDPVGRTFETMDRLPGLWKIVGVVGDLRSSGMDPEPRPMVYLPHAQQPLAIMTFVIRTQADPMSVAAAVQREIWSLGRMMNVYQVQTMEQRLEESVWQARFTMIVLGCFAALALLLAAAGIYAVISYAVSQRTREIGIRMALGARRSEVLVLILRQGMVLALAGVVIGAAGSYALSGLISGMLYGVQPGDPATIAAVAAILLAVAAAACLTPAVRASGIQPVRALRNS